MIYKHVNADLYRYKRAGMVFYRSSSDLTTEEMARSISAFKDFSNEHGFPLPDADNHAWLRQTENELERAGRMG